MGKFDWLEKRALRAVDQLRLWSENPRLDPDDAHVSLADYASDLIVENGEKDSFLDLINSIAIDGFIPADPIVVWKNCDNKKYYVAEGNRRTLALKLLRTPSKAPKSIRSYVRKYSEKIKREDLDKIRVCIAPSFEETEWYINQRHARSSIQRPWSRLQQQRWIARIYDKYNGDIEKVKSVTRINKSELEFTLRILHIRDYALAPRVLKKLSKDEKEKVKSHRIPMTILERWFTNAVVKEEWGIEFDNDDVNIISNRTSFLNAYVEWIKLVLHRDDPDVTLCINTRTITTDLRNILDHLPKVKFGTDDDISKSNEQDTSSDNDSVNGDESTSENADQNNEKASEGEKKNDKPKKPLSKNPDRNQMVVPWCQLQTSNFKLDALFREFKKIPVLSYRNCVAASLRVFLDIAVYEFLVCENCVEEIQERYNDKKLPKITLKQRLEFLKQKKLTSRTPSFKVVDQLLNNNNQFSLDTLNSYIHGNAIHHTGRRFINKFWDFLFPLFEKIMEIKEDY